MTIDDVNRYKILLNPDNHYIDAFIGENSNGEDAWISITRGTVKKRTFRDDGYISESVYPLYE